MYAASFKQTWLRTRLDKYGNRPEASIEHYFELSTSFSYYGAILWNNFAIEVKQAPSPLVFKEMLLLFFSFNSKLAYTMLLLSLYVIFAFSIVFLFIASR